MGTYNCMEKDLINNIGATSVRDLIRWTAFSNMRFMLLTFILFNTVFN